MSTNYFSVGRTSYVLSMQRKFLRTLNPLELSVKVLTGWKSGDLFVGSKETAEGIERDADLLGRGGRKWGGGNGFGEGATKFEPVEIVAFRREMKADREMMAQSNRKLEKIRRRNATEVVPALQQAPPDEEHDHRSALSEEDERSKGICWDEGKCRYPFCCFNVTANRALCAWTFQIVLALCFFTAGTYFGIVGVVLNGVFAWTYMVMAGVILTAPIASWLAIIACSRLFRAVVDMVSDPLYPEKAEPMLNLLYLNEKMSVELMVLLTCFLYTISFLLIFAGHPADNFRWTQAYHYTSAVLGTLTVWALGSVFSQYLTHTITKEVNVHSLGSKVRSVLRAEVAIWRTLNILPNARDMELYELMEDPFLTYDPKKASDLARALVRTPMMGTYTPQRDRRSSKKVIIKIDTDRHADLLGNWCYVEIMSASKRTIPSGVNIQHKAATYFKSPTSPPPKSHVDTIIEDYYSQREQRLARFNRLHRRSLEAHSNIRTDEQGFEVAHIVFNYLDLAIPYDYVRDAIEVAAEDEPWSRVGVIRGVPKYSVTMEDLKMALWTDDPAFDKLPEVDIRQAWEFLDPENVGRVNLKRVKNAVKGLVQDRRNLKTTLENTAQVVLKLRSVISICINFFVFLCALAIFGLDVLEVWVGISSVVLAFSFVFGGTLKGVFDSVVFLFGVHPYDVGDKIKLGPTEETYWIKRISLMSTQMARWDGAYVRFMNQYLFNVFPLINVRRSGNHEKTISIEFDAAALPNRYELEKMQFEMEQFLARSPGSYTGSCSITARDILPLLRVKVTIWWSFVYPDIDAGRTFRDTSKFIHFVIATFKKRNIKVSAVNSGQVDLERGGQKKVVGLQGQGTTRII